MNLTKNIILNETEKQIRNVLLEVTRNLEKTQPQIQLRIAGGWVRDKLMGNESNDIDIAIDTMNGEPFAKAVKLFMEERGFPISQVSKIQLNPEKSKHLETATARLFGLDVDFVNLRSETYKETSRNPEVSFGTPLEDALRRDITINSLFFNLHTELVEDFTNQGIKDLNDGIIRTPMPALQTFIDDPLRVLRVIRFATRFGFQIHSEIIEATKNENLKQSFATKLSKERVGIEMDKMMKGADPLRALDTIIQFGFYDIVYELPENIQHQQSKLAENLKSIKTLNSVLKADWLPRILWNSNPLSDVCRGQLYLAISVASFRNDTYKVKHKSMSIVKYLISHSLKMSLVYGEFCHLVLTHADRIRELVKQNSESTLSRKTLGLLVRDLGVRPLGNQWDFAVLVALVLEISSKDLADDASKLESTVNEFSKFMADIFSFGLEKSHELKPLMDGKEILATLNIKPGPHLGVLIQQLIEWQLSQVNPTKDEAIAYVLHHCRKN
ncbi:CCA tRNA nucleotidyltransferase, mitochondrial [Globomyces sp. JEL0801]|nr:CCA tRNA nucleotidyltransferase, mitochondrial [Globomyces sp. JEL0801]